MRKIIPLVIASIVCLFFLGCSKKNPTSSTVSGPGTITGIVTKIADSTVISGAVVSTAPATSIVTTNADGRYIIDSIAAGSYTITAVKNGYISKTLSVRVATSNTTTANLTLIANTTIFEWISIPSGNFIMGSLSSDPEATSAEQPQHKVYLDAYQISKYEITNAQYKAFMDAGGYSTQSYWSDSGWAWRTTNVITEPLYWTSGQYNNGPNFPNYPVVGVSWYEAYAFCNWAGGRLPTEAEWEKAARGTDSSNYWPWGSTWDASKCNSSYNASPDTFAYCSPVGFFSTGTSPYGVYDMAGNAGEWVHDMLLPEYYTFSPDSNPQGPSWGGVYAIRGGCWMWGQSSSRTASRWYDPPWRSCEIYGIRMAK